MKTSITVSALVLVLCAALNAHAAWERQESGTLSWLYDIHFVDDDHGWIAGSRGELLKTSDGGKTWLKSAKFSDDSIKRVYFSDKQNGWLLCERDIYRLGPDPPSYFLRTSDGGKTWEKLDFPGKRRIANVFFNRDAVFAVGEAGAMFALDGAASQWKTRPAPVRFLLIDGAFMDDSRGAIVGGGGTILYTEDAGTTWRPARVWGRSETKLNAVFFLNRLLGWAVGDGGEIFQTVSRGKRWHKQRTPVSTDLNDIHFADTAIGWAVGDGGKVLFTRTAGNVWRQEESGTRHRLEKAVFAGGRAWAVGFGGTIISKDLPEIRARRRAQNLTSDATLP